MPGRLYYPYINHPTHLTLNLLLAVCVVSVYLPCLPLTGYLPICLPRLLPQDVYGQEIAKMRPVILREDPTGLFRTKYLSGLFELPY